MPYAVLLAQVAAELTPLSVNKVGVQFKVFKIFGLINIKAPPSARGEAPVCARGLGGIGVNGRSCLAAAHAHTSYNLTSGSARLPAQSSTYLTDWAEGCLAVSVRCLPCIAACG